MIADDLYSYMAELAPLDGKTISRLVARGIDPHALAVPLQVGRARVLFDGKGRYSPTSMGESVLLFPIIANRLIDLAAWHGPSGRIATRLGDGACLGQGQIGLNGLGTTGEALPVWRSPIEWLKADRVGIVIADCALAARMLAGLTLRAEDLAHQAALAKSLLMPPPTIVVATNSDEAAAA
jgi:hypothetical protein